MKYIKFLHEEKPTWGVLVDERINIINGSIFDGLNFTGETAKYDETKLLAPCEATKVVCIGKNYYDHAVEMNEGIPENPTIFFKPTSAIIPHLGEIQMPKISQRVDYECEIAVVIKKTAKNVKPEDVNEYILGYTCLNDVTARDIQKSDKQWTRGKSFDTFCPIGPIISDEIDINNTEIFTKLNGEIKQHSNTSKFMWNLGELLSFITECMTLYPGDVVTTGTPAGVGPMKSGDVVEVVIENLGILKNNVV